MTKKQKRFAPLLLAFGVILGVLIGTFFSAHTSGRKLNLALSSNNKINDLLLLIQDEYVDTVNMNQLIDQSLPIILRQLDPHSSYFSAQEAESSMNELNGNYSGIGIDLFPYNDSVRITRVYKGSPAQNEGILSGDILLSVDSMRVVGNADSISPAIKLLQGKTNSIVGIQVSRQGYNAPLNFKVKREKVHINSIEAAYPIDDNVGYVKIKNFSENTYPEFLAAIASINNEQTIEALVIDLRNNSGGYIMPAIQIAQEFLPKNALIVYTQGIHSPKKEYRCDGRGSYQKIPLFVLVNEYTASASEILTGALQDNDRATIIGRRTFGKGLVQVPIQFRDGSILRLTKARYYTPTGRCIQKPYTPGKNGDYNLEIVNRELKGELFDANKMPTDGKKFETQGGKIVYDKGGITPDEFVAYDEHAQNTYYTIAMQKGLIDLFAYSIVDKYYDKLKVLDDEALIAFLNKKRITYLFPAFAQRKGVKPRYVLFKQALPLFKQVIYMKIIQYAKGDEEAIRFYNHYDPITQKALKDIKRLHSTKK